MKCMRECVDWKCDFVLLELLAFVAPRNTTQIYAAAVHILQAFISFAINSTSERE